MSAFTKRVDRAIELFLSRNTNRREFEDCFEMGDGSRVAARVCEYALYDNRLRAAVESYWKCRVTQKYIGILNECHRASRKNANPQKSASAWERRESYMRENRIE